MVDLARARRRTRRIVRVPRESSDFFAFGGGLNLLDSPLTAKPGQCQGALNYEMGLAGGYRRVGGYRHFDGTPDSGVTYDLMGYGAATRPAFAASDAVDGDTSGAASIYLDNTEDGGFAVQRALYNEELENADWSEVTAGKVTRTDGDEAWSGGLVSTLTKLTESVDGSGNHRHGIEKTTDISVAVGDLVYISCFVRYTAGQREGIVMTLEDQTAWTLSSVLVGFNVKDQSVNSLSGGTAVIDAGIELVSGSVYRCWALTTIADTADAGVTFSVQMAKDTGSGTVGNGYTGDGSYIHVTGPMACIVPENALSEGLDFSGSDWSQSNVTVTKDDLSWSAGKYAFFQKLADSTDGSDTTHEIVATSSNDFPVRVGDIVFVECYCRYTSGQLPAVSLQLLGEGWRTLTGVNTVSANFDIQAQTAGTSSSGIASSGVEVIDSTTCRIWMLTDPATNVETGEDAYVINQNPVDTSSYTGAGLYSHIAGLRVVVRGPTARSPDQALRYGYVTTEGVAKNVRSGDLIIGQVVGTYQDDEDISILSSVFGQAVGTNVTDGESDTTLDAAYRALAVAAGAAATEPPGSGAVRGIWIYNGTKYCFRDNAGATACVMWEATVAGWAEVTLNDRLSFDAGDNNEPVEGDTLDGVTSGASAKILRLVVTSGTFGVDAAGYFILGTVTSGPFQNNEVLNVSAARVADADGVNAAQTMAAGGKYEFRNHNFYGAEDLYRMYGVHGKGLAFEYDDDATEPFFCEIETGMVVDTPVHIGVHNSHLILAFPGGSNQVSADGDPVSWEVILGASEISVGDQITGYNEEVGNSLFIFTRNKTFVLQGNTKANFDLDDFNVKSGAREWSIQRIGLGTFFDDRGFTTIEHTQRVGSTNFTDNTVSELIQPLVEDLAKNTNVRCSHLLRTRNIYRCYFEDGRVVSIGFDNNKVTGHMVLQYPFIANVAVSGEGASGAEEIYVGADDGKVYQLETGTSFDGEDVLAYLRTVLYNSKSPGQFKKYRQIRLDATLSGALQLVGQVEYDFHNEGFNLAEELDFSTDESGGYWDEFVWDNFVWDKPTSGIPQVKLEGEGVNAAIYLRTESDSDPSHTLRGVSLQWLPRRYDRRN